MKKVYDIKRIKEIIKLGKRLPFILEHDHERDFVATYRSIVINNRQKNDINEFLSEDTQQFITTLYCHWLKISKLSNLYFVEVDNQIEDTYEHNVVDDENYQIIFFKEPKNKFERVEECLADVPPELMSEYFQWLKHEIVSASSVRELKSKYRPVTEMLNEIKEENNDDLSDEFYDSLELMKDSIKKAIIEDKITSGVIDEKTTTENIERIIAETTEELKAECDYIYEQDITVNWKEQTVSLKIPLDITNMINLDLNSFSYLQDKNGWLLQQSRQVQETLYALWVDYINSVNHSNDSPNELKLGWSTFMEYLVEWLRYDCNTDPKKIEKKLTETYSKLMENGAIKSFQYVNNCSAFITVLLYICENVSKESGSGILFNYKNIQKQYLYNLDNDQTLSLVWGGIIHDKIIKTKASLTTLRQFEVLKERFPNFKEVIDYYSGAMYIYEKTGTTPAPVLLLGSPGLGKTHFANEISKIIGSQMTVISISSLTAGWIISGSASQWKDAQMGKVATSLLNGSTMSPVIVLDEIDKKTEGNYNPVGALYPLLEQQTAKEFVDEYLEFPIDASNVLWVATANNLNSIDEPILDRFVVFEIKKLSSEETIKVAKTIYSELTMNLLGGGLDEEVLNLLKDKTPRQIKQILKKGLAYAATQRNNEVVVKKEHLDLMVKNRKMGF